MSLYLCSLNSGSNGNCYYLGNQKEAVLVDAGISCRETVLRLERSGLSIRNVKAIFISHEHSDHIRGVEVLSRKFRIPVYITHSTLKHSRLHLEKPLVKHFVPLEKIRIGGLTVKTIPKHHDGIDPHSFIVSSKGITAGVFTDIGKACEHLTGHLRFCHAAFLESNYDPEMLQKGSYPAFLKQRIRGGDGHLSNHQALDLFLNHRAPFMRLLILSHLSEQNNHSRVVEDLFHPHADGTRIEIASRYGESRVFRVR
ncbi:MAG: MBL fold metallo-hydrolase [bacterium]